MATGGVPSWRPAYALATPSTKDGYPACVVTRLQYQEQPRRLPALAAKTHKQGSATDGLGAADCTQSGPEQRDRTTVMTILTSAQNGTSGVVACGTHARRPVALATPRTGVLSQVH